MAVSAWEGLFNTMWKYQWMKEYVPLTTDLSDAFFEESGGVIDRVVKFLMYIGGNKL